MLSASFLTRGNEFPSPLRKTRHEKTTRGVSYDILVLHPAYATHTKTPSHVTRTVQLKLNIDMKPNLRCRIIVRTMPIRPLKRRRATPSAPVSCPGEQVYRRRDGDDYPVDFSMNRSDRRSGAHRIEWAWYSMERRAPRAHDQHVGSSPQDARYQGSRVPGIKAAVYGRKLSAARCK